MGSFRPFRQSFLLFAPPFVLLATTLPATCQEVLAANLDCLFFLAQEETPTLPPFVSSPLSLHPSFGTPGIQDPIFSTPLTPLSFHSLRTQVDISAHTRFPSILDIGAQPAPSTGNAYILSTFYGQPQSFTHNDPLREVYTRPPPFFPTIFGLQRLSRPIIGSWGCSLLFIDCKLPPPPLFLLSFPLVPRFPPPPPPFLLFPSVMQSTLA